MASVSVLDASTAQLLRAKLEALDGVERAVVDELTSSVWLNCGPDCDTSGLRPAVDVALRDAGLMPESFSLHLLTNLAVRRRVKFTSVERLPERNKQVRVRVTLEWSEQIAYGESTGESGELIELRTAAAAALSALEKVLPEPLNVKLVGVKQLRAFDTDLMVVALYRGGSEPQRYVASVAVGADPRRAAAVAVLNALNRVLGNYLSVR